MDDGAAPLPALAKAMAGMVDAGSADAALAGGSAHGAEQVPHSTAPIIAIAAQAGLGVTAGEHIQLCSGETVTLMSGQDTQFVAGGAMRVHTGQAIGVLGGAVKPGDDGIGLQMIAAQGPIDVQAQSDELKIQARDEVNIVSANAHIDWAAAKRISLSTAGGANITIEGGNITVQCPGKLTIHAGQKHFLAADTLDYPLPVLPKSSTKPEKLAFDLMLTATPGPQGTALAGYEWKIVRVGGATRDRTIVQGVTDEDGKLQMTALQELRLSVAVARWPGHLLLIAPGVERPFDIHAEQPGWTASERILHALAALDFSDRPGTHIATRTSRLERARAAEAINEAPTFDFFRELQ